MMPEWIFILPLYLKEMLFRVEKPAKKWGYKGQKPEFSPP